MRIATSVTVIAITVVISVTHIRAETLRIMHRLTNVSSFISKIELLHNYNAKGVGPIRHVLTMIVFNIIISRLYPVQ